MPVDPFAVLNALLRAEASRHERTTHPTGTEPEGAPSPEPRSTPTPVREERTGH
ncbi:hypothetical protein J7E93_20735 [Streptomyces sp. ISL-36]|uniref:hypothetical protein n=1 Tax=Streptomyces sp. ISL-36 TaxID=2819182 RepID=UPI001BE9C512|nr:hypothetical protein [Streptomyces sp. ISL-36]MBT2442489.1 hypothetical protein [Streptomyces sp. ISL-36]